MIYEATLNVKEMTTSEVLDLIYKDCYSVSEFVAMTEEIALQIIECDHFEQSLVDWAWMTVQGMLEKQA